MGILKRYSALVVVTALALGACHDQPAEPNLRTSDAPSAAFSGFVNPSPFGVGVGLYDPPEWDTVVCGTCWPHPIYRNHSDWIVWAKKAGVGWVKLDFEMKTDGQLNDPTRVEYSVNLARQHGLSIVGMLIGATDNRQYPNITTWQNFVAPVVAAYSDRVSHWEIWNESNDTSFLYHPGSPKGFVTGSQYAALVNAVAPYIHAAGSYVVAPSVYWNARDYRQFLIDAMNGSGNNVDVVSWHTYRQFGWEAVADLADVSSVRAGSWWSAKPLWATEIGGMPEQHGLGSQIEVVSAISKEMAENGRADDKILVWHGHAYPKPGTTSDAVLVHSILRPQVVEFPTGGHTIYSQPTPRASFWAYLKGALYGCSDSTVPCAPSNVTAGVHRWRTEGSSGHLYSLNPDETNGVWGWKRERLNVLRLRRDSRADFTQGSLKLLYQCYSFDGHMLTDNPGCEGKPGFGFDRTLGWVSDVQAPGMYPVWRMYRAFNSDWWTVACPGERSAALSTGYVDDRFLGYAWGDCPPQYQDVTRFYHAGSGSHLYSLDPNEVSGNGWLTEYYSYFRVASTPVSPFTKPLYQCWMQQAHYLAVSYYNCDGRGGTLDRTIGFIAYMPATGLVPLKLLYRASDSDYLTTACTAHYNSALNAGYQPVTTLGYVQGTVCSS